MSTKYPGGIISKTAPTPSGSLETSTAPGIWTLEQQAYWQKLGQWPIPGNVPNYIEDVFSTYLYTSDGTTQTITNGIDLSTYGGMVWIKNRSAAQNHYLSTTTLGIQNTLTSNNTGGLGIGSDIVHSVTTTGFTAPYNFNIGENLASWTFRKQPKFFDVVTWTGTGSTQNIAHNLGSTPGCIIVKCTSNATGWAVYHRGIGATNYLVLNSTAASAADIALWNNTSPTSTQFTVGTDAWVNSTGFTYVAYLFAHNAGGFGLTGTDNVISCGSCTADGSGNYSVTLGYEPQWVLIKSAGSGRWNLYDNMRGATASSGYSSAQRLQPQASDAEDTQSSPYGLGINATGFTGNAAVFSTDLIYIAIRRGPMKVPTSGTSVFSPVARTGTGLQTNVSGLSFSPDLLLVKNRGNTQLNWAFDKLRGGNQPLSSNSTDDEATNISNYFGGSTVFTPNNTGFGISNAAQVNTTSGSYANWLFGRAPSFFDEVCYTGTGSARTVTHNLAAVPEMMIVKNRTLSSNWTIYTATTGNGYAMNFDTAAPFADGGVVWNSTSPTSTVFSVATNDRVNGSSSTYVAYLFATCAGVSKVFSYTGNGSSQTINCGFTGGARFVLIKRTDASGDWYVWDTARGMVSGTDPSLLLNSTAAEVNANSIYTTTGGFQIVSTAAGINASGGTYIFLSIA